MSYLQLRSGTSPGDCQLRPAVPWESSCCGTRTHVSSLHAQSDPYSICVTQCWLDSQKWGILGPEISAFCIGQHITGHVTPRNMSYYHRPCDTLQYGPTGFCFLSGWLCSTNSLLKHSSAATTTLKAMHYTRYTEASRLQGPAEHQVACIKTHGSGADQRPARFDQL